MGRDLGWHRSCHQGGVCSSSPGFAGGRHFTGCQCSFYPVPAAKGTLRIGRVCKASLASSPFLRLTMPAFLKMGNFLLEASAGRLCHHSL